jgi:type I restriction enzyme S subunit
LLRQGAATTFDSVNKDIINDFELIIPSDNQQRNAVGAILSSLDSKIELNNQINKEIEHLAKTIYDYWFVQFDFPDANGKPYKSSGGKMVWNEELKREIPEKWRLKSLKGLIDFDRGISYSSKDIESPEGIPMINLASIDTDCNYRPNELKFFSGKYTTNKLVSHGDMLVACTDLTQNADIIGSPIIVPKEYDKYLYSMDLAKVNVLTSELNYMYLYMTLRTNFYHKYIKYFASGTNVLHLNLDGILWYPIAIPPNDLQLKFASLIETSVRKQAEILNENDQLSKLRDWLLPMLMNGQVRVV